MVRGFVTFVLACVFAMAAIPAVAGAEVGGLDPSFGPVRGRVVVPPAFGITAAATGEDVASGPKDEILVLRRQYGSCAAPACGTDLYLQRIGADGNLDAGYGPLGASDLVPIAATGPRTLSASVQFTPAGKPLVVDSDGSVVTMARFLPDGSLDPSFGIGGISRSDLGGATIGVGARAAIGRDGRIVVVTAAGMGPGRIVLARYLPDGTLDPGFAAGRGYEVQSPPGTPGGLALLSGGGIVVAGSSCCAPAGGNTIDLGRWLPSGDSAGARFPRQVYLRSQISVSGVFVRPKGQIEVVAGLPNGTLIADFRRDGSLVRSFGRHGVARLGLIDVRGGPIQAAVDGRGRTLAMGAPKGFEPFEGTEASLLVRRLADGRVDPNFQATGLGFTYPRGISLDSKGRIVVLGAEQCYRVCSSNLVVERIIGRRTTSGGKR